MANRIEWHGPEAMDHCRKRAVGFLTRAAMTVFRRARELLSLPGTTFRIKTTRRKGKTYRKGSRRTGAVRSLPGEPPRKQHGELWKRVAYEVDPNELEARVGTNYKVGKHLELGTKRGLKSRPWLRRALAESHSKIMGFLSQIGGD